MHYLYLFLFVPVLAWSAVWNGIDLVNEESYVPLLKGRHIGMITNHTAMTRELQPSREYLREVLKKMGGHTQLVALFAPEHGLWGVAHAGEAVAHAKDKEGIPVYSLHGSTRRPTAEMLAGIDLLIYDVQDIGTRSYTYISTLFYVMEEAAKAKIPVLILDRPNPINGLTIDGPMLEEKWRSFVGYLNVPYVHGMTVGELARYFNAVYKIGCEVHVIPMKGWKRAMSFSETGLAWIPTSPHIPEADTPLYYPVTGILGELELVNIGIGYTQPFKLIGAPWIRAEEFSQKLNQAKLPGVTFLPAYYKPFYGTFKRQDLEGVRIIITQPKTYQPVTTFYLILATLRDLYPKPFREALKKTEGKREMFCKVCGCDKILKILEETGPLFWSLRNIHHAEFKAFKTAREPYLLYP